MELRINYEQVLAQVAALRVQEQDLNAQLNSLKALREQTRSAWQSPASQAFLSKLDELISDLTRTKTKLGQLIDTIKRVADRIKMQDELLSKAATALI